MSTTSINPFKRSDGLNVSVDYSDPIVKRYTLVDHVEVLDPDDPQAFVIHKVPKLIEEYDINKEIAENAKGTDLKSQVLALLDSGSDLSELAFRDDQAIDVSMIPNDSIDPVADMKANIPDALAGLTSDQLQTLLDAIIAEQSKKSETVEKTEVKQEIPEKKTESEVKDNE